MRRTTWGRLLAAVMAVWLSLSLSEPAFLHACPVRSASHAPGGANAGLHAAMAHGASHAATDAPSPGGTSHAGCTCLGDCCGAAPLGLRAAGVTLAEMATAAT